MPKRQVLPQPETSAADATSRSLRLTPQQMDRLVSQQGSAIPRTEIVSADRYQQQIEQLRRELQQLTEKMSQLKQKMAQAEESGQLSTQAELSETISKPPRPETTEIQTQPTLIKRGETRTVQSRQVGGQEQVEEPLVLGTQDTTDFRGRIRQQLDKLQASQKEKQSGVTEQSYERLIAAERAKRAATEKKKSGKEESSLETSRTVSPGARQSYLDMIADIETEQGPTDKTSAVKEVEQLSRSEAAAEAKRIMGPHQNIESFSQSQFEQAVVAAQTYLKQGRYYKAADSYALAAIYRRDDPGVYAGRAYALFAAGEYVSSALFLARALELSGDYIQTKVDLSVLLGGKENLNSRIADLELWLERTGAPELRFLLAYLYYRTGVTDRARSMIDIAAEKMPNAQAVQTLKKVIDSSLTAPKSK